MNATAMVPLKNGSSPYTSSLRPQRGSRARSACGPRASGLAVVLRSLGDETSFVALNSGRLAHDIGVPRFTHTGRLWELRGGNGVVSPAFFALHDAVNTLGAADIGDVEPGDTGMRPEAVDLLVRGRQREKIVDALLCREARIMNG